jgi:hypothetical protein
VSAPSEVLDPAQATGLRWVPTPSSSNVQAVAWYGGDERGDIYVQYRSGDVYCYRDCADATYTALVREAPSKGKFVRQVLQANHACQKVGKLPS